MNEIIQFLVEPMSYGFMQKALMVTLAAALATGVLSGWLILLGYSLLGDAISHAVLPGVVLASLLGVPYILGALVFGLGSVGLIHAVRSRSHLGSDTVMGVIFTSLFALGILLISIIPSGVDLTHILFGNVLGVTTQIFWQVMILAAAVLLFVAYKRHDFTLVAFDPIQAHSIGTSPSRVQASFLVALAVTVVVSLQAVGVILVVAMLIIPGAAASLVTRNLRSLVALAVGISLLSSIIGVYASYYADSATGASVVVTQSLIFAIIWTVRTVREGLHRGKLTSAHSGRGGLPQGHL